MPAFRPRIAIAGGGPGGLALGLLLRQRNIPVTIYELRGKPTPEELVKPSGMLDLHEGSGLTAIRECGLWDSFQEAIGDCSESTRVFNPEGSLLHTDEGGPTLRPEIPRHALTNMLVQNLPADTIKWNHKITAVSSARNATTGATEITLDLSSNGTATFDFVVGADGAWSRVRKLLTDATPQYHGVQYLTMTMRHTSTNYPHLVELVGSGAFIALGGGRGIMTHRGPQDSIRVYVAVSTPHEHWAATLGLKGKTAAEIKTTLLADEKLFRNWAPQFLDLLATACDEETKDHPGCEADITPLYTLYRDSLPKGHRWEHRTGATLLGDAAHLMLPSGEGVNLALLDALNLAHALAAVPEGADAAAWQAAVEPRVREFEEAMLAGALSEAGDSAALNGMLFSENGAQALADFFATALAMAAAGSPEE
jgi:2-polyprenyl-6-methoxyphenol hydroxylase-like FAD-dependent oxidoreductase